MPDAPPQCRVCSGVAGRHTSACGSPGATGLHFARGNERCDRCSVGFDVGDPYTHVEEDGVDFVTCLGCAAHASIGGLS